MSEKSWEGQDNWAQGPPKSECEGWNFERRAEVASWASHFVAMQVGSLARGAPEDWKESPNNFDAIDTSAAVKLALRLQVSLDTLCPKR